MARRKETSKEKEEEKQFDTTTADRDKIFISDYYNEEILNVAIDYVKSLAAANLLVTK